MKTILPHEYDAVAQAAYAKFREHFPKNPAWSQVSPAAQIVWRDRVHSTLKMQKMDDLPILEESCTLAAIREFGEIAPAKIQPLKAEPVKPASETKPAKPATKKEK